MHESHVLWKEHELRQHQKMDSLGSDMIWFSRIRNQLQKDMNHKHLLLGDSLLESALPQGRKTVSEINRLFFSKGLIGDFEKALAIATTFGAIGRAGEYSFLTYDQAEWNSVHDILVLDWNEVNTDK